MDRPLWQILFTLTFAGFAVQRAAAGYVLHEGDMHPALLATYGLQLCLAATTAVGMWLGRTWTVGALIALGAMLVAASLQEGFWLGLHPPVAAVSESLIVALATGALALALRHEFGGDRSEREPPLRGPRSPRRNPRRSAPRS